MARMNHGSFAFTTVAKSAKVAVTPPTYTRSVVPLSAAGMVSVTQGSDEGRMWPSPRARWPGSPG